MSPTAFLERVVVTFCSPSRWISLVACCAALHIGATANAQPAPPSPNAFPPWWKLIQKVQGVIVEIDRIDPEIRWVNQSASVSYSIINFGSQSLSGSLTAAFSGSPPVASVSIQIPPGGSHQDRIVLPPWPIAGMSTVVLAFDSHSDCRMVPWGPDSKPRRICRTNIHEEDSAQINFLEELGILTTPDVPENVLPVSSGMCGSGLYPTNSVGAARIVPNTGAPFEWAPGPGGPAVPVLGRVVYTNRDRKKDDIPWDHPFGFDFWFNVAPESRYLPLLSTAGLASAADCPIGGFPLPGQTLPGACTQTDIGVRPNHDADACESFLHRES